MRLVPGSFLTDRGTFEECLSKAAKARDDKERIKCLQAAIDLYQAEFLADYSDYWIDAERHRLSDAYHAALRRLIKAFVNTNQLQHAIQLGKRAVEADPYREETHRLLMQVYCLAGRPSAAIRQYRELEIALKQALDIAPSPLTSKLLTQLCQTNGSAPPASVDQSAPALARQPVASPVSLTSMRLPRPLSRLIGRDDTVLRILDSLETPETRLVTLTGIGGIGKTRVAQAIALQLRKEGKLVGFLSLVDLPQADRIVPRLARMLGLEIPPDEEVSDRVIQALSGQPALIVLDNMEHLLPDAAPIIQYLLEQTPELRLLVTSRRRLGVVGEQEHLIGPLPLPNEDYWETLPECASVRLWLERATAANPRFQLTKENAPDIAALCRRLDGIPLALELAAGWSGILSVREMLDRLNNRFELLIHRFPPADSRHTSMRAVLASSFELLPPQTQRFLTRLALFSGGWTIESARQVCDEADVCTTNCKSARSFADPTG